MASITIKVYLELKYLPSKPNFMMSSQTFEMLLTMKDLFSFPQQFKGNFRHIHTKCIKLFFYWQTQGFEAYVGLQLLRTALSGVVAEWQVFYSLFWQHLCITLTGLFTTPVWKKKKNPSNLDVWHPHWKLVNIENLVSSWSCFPFPSNSLILNTCGSVLSIWFSDDKRLCCGRSWFVAFFWLWWPLETSSTQ